MKSVLNNLKILFNDFYFLIVVAVCVALFLLKLPYLELPYFSDELWVYGPSLRKMGSNFPSLLPSSLNIEEHWGHPLMYFFIGSIWCMIFGTSIISTHIFSAVVSTFLLITIYIIVKKVFNKQLAFFSVVVFASQSIFLGQYNLVLPEIMLTLFMFVCLYAYINKKNVLYIVAGACLVLIKETGVLFIGSIILWHFLKNMIYEKNYKLNFNTLKNYIFLLFPLFFIAIHVLMLKYLYGWFIVPKRVEHFTFSWEIYYDRIRDTFYYIFINQGRKSITLVLFVALILFYNKIKIWQRIILFVFVFSLIKIFFNYWKLPAIFPMIIVPIIISVLTKFLFWDTYKAKKETGNFIAISTLFIYVYILFSASQFDSLRYLLCVIPLAIIIVFFTVQNNLPKFKTWLLPILTILFISTSIIYIIKDENFGDDTLNYNQACDINLEAVHYMESKDFYEHNIQVPFLFKYQLTDYKTGYLKTEKSFTNVNAYDVNQTEFNEKQIYVFTNVDVPVFYKQLKESGKFRLDKRITKGIHWVEIYLPIN